MPYITKTIRGTDISLDDNSIANLRGLLRGTLLLPGDPGYDDARTVWNGMIDRRPALVARCLGLADVITCVNFARERELLLSIKGGGHNISGLAVGEGSLMIDLSLMRGVWVDPESRVAHAQAGCLLGDVDRETQIHGLAAILGFVSLTGIAGLTLGGGFGYLTRQYGWTSDNVTAMELITADGRLVRASETENPDLFWGLRGGGGNFGVLTGIDYQLYSVGPEIIAGAIAWRGEDAPKVLELHRTLTEQGSPQLTCAAALRIAPPAPWLPKEIHGKPIVVLFVCHSGSLQDGEKEVAQIKSFGSPVGDIVQRRPYISQQSILDATQPKGRRYYWKSEYLPGISPALLGKVVEHSARIVSPHSAIILFPIGGAIRNFPDEHSSVGNRNANVVLNIAASWEHAKDDEANIAWAQEAWRDMRSFSTGGTYINFLTAEEGDERIRAAYGKSYDRLIDLKTQWDPENMFRMNKNFAPRGK